MLCQQPLLTILSKEKEKNSSRLQCFSCSFLEGYDFPVVTFFNLKKSKLIKRDAYKQRITNGIHCLRRLLI